jgi:CubicO group peptidase (beta-lactamase class C family)
MSKKNLTRIMNGIPKVRITSSLLLPALGAAAVVTIISMSSCEKDLEFAAAPFHHFDVMAEKLEENIAPFTVGMGYAIIQKGTLKANGSAGFRQLAGAAPALPYTPTTRQTIFSITKTLSAAATMAYLKKHNVPITSSIVDYFPHTWAVENFPTSITFEDLMQHRSGLVGTLDSYDDMKDYIEAGMFQPRGNYVYANINYTLLRILVPMVNENTRFSTTTSVMNDWNINIFLSYKFVDIMREEVTTPAGISADAGPTIWDMADVNNATLLYNFQNQS